MSEPAEVLRVGSREVGPGRPAFVIAEAGVNHNGNPELALRLIDAAAAAGADAVKFQTFRPHELVTAWAPQAAYQRRPGGGAPRSQLAMLEGLALPDEAFAHLQAHARARGLTFLSTPFDSESLRLLVRLGVPALKVGSGDLTNLPFLREVGATGLPVILSTGMGTLGEVEDALDALDAGRRQGAAARPGGDGEAAAGAGAGGARAVAGVALLHCVSSYPAPPAACNLAAMATLRQAFGLPVGFSDHTAGTAVAVAAVALGACIIEKHFTLDRGLPGPDHQASLEPRELARLVADIRAAEAARGDGRKRLTPAEADVARAARRSLVAAVDIPAGATIRAEMVAAKRPGNGIAPKHLALVVGRRAARAVRRDEPLAWDALAP